MTIMIINVFLFLATQTYPYDFPEKENKRQTSDEEWVPSDNECPVELLDMEGQHTLEEEPEEIPEDNDQQYIDYGDDDETIAQKVTCNTRFAIYSN